MDAKERAHLRALCEDVALPLRAECTLSGHELVDANDEYIGDIETGHSDDDEWCDEVHADLIVGAVNALPALLDALDAAERDRDEARAEVERLRRELAEARGDFAEMRVDRDAYKSALDRAIELRIGDRAEARLDERWACSEFAEKWLREVSAITQDTPADLADAIRTRGAGGAT